ncbi:MAG: shikimate dehydrogenase [Muribaculaceae bacterium]|nr:shikimate dehydrogenase [Muribaculaceae bacterium]
MEFGLIGKTLGHSFSAKYFNEKFKKEDIDATYSLFPLENIDLFTRLIKDHPLLKGLNVTIPYKVEIMKYLDELSEEAQEIGAVNVIKFIRSGENLILRGYNSDAYGFTESMKAVLESIGYEVSEEGPRPLALVLGTGGASRAVVWSMRRLGFETQLIGRSHRDDCLSYGELTPEMIYEAKAVINCTPLGTSPDVNRAAPFPYEYLHVGQVCFDLVYNPAETLFMKICKAHGCTVSNGLEMLRLQAVGAWKIWTEQS